MPEPTNFPPDCKEIDPVPEHIDGRRWHIDGYHICTYEYGFGTICWSLEPTDYGKGLWFCNAVRDHEEALMCAQAAAWAIYLTRGE